MPLKKSRAARLVVFSIITACSLALVSTTEAQEQSKSQQGCITGVNKATRGVAKAQARTTAACLKTASTEGTPASLDPCLTTDPKDAVAKARTKAEDTATDKCAVPPNFGYTSATTASDSAVAQENELFHDVFGDDAGNALIVADSDAIGAKCQQQIKKGYEKILQAQLLVFASCKKDGLKSGAITSQATLAACLVAINTDAKGKIAKAVEKVGSTLTKSCPGVDLAAAFPGVCAATGFPECIRVTSYCRACLLLDEADGTGAYCDAVDNGVADGSCVDPRRCGNGTLEPGEVCDDGNNASGDCCNATCGAEPPGQPCTDDSDVCTVDECDGAGTCAHDFSGAPGCSTVHVSPTGIGGACTQASPCSLDTGLTVVAAGETVRLLQGTYPLSAPLTDVPSDVTIEGGFDGSWVKTGAPASTVLSRDTSNPDGAVNQQRLVAVQLSSKSGFTFDNLRIETAAASSNGESTYGVHLTSCSSYSFAGVEIAAGNAGAGADGSSGTDGSAGTNADNGLAGSCNIESAPGNGGNGGSGAGASAGGPGAGGVDLAGCCVLGVVGEPGTASTAYSSGGGGGGGGSGGEESDNGGAGGSGGGVDGGAQQTPIGSGGPWGDPGSIGGSGSAGATGVDGSAGSAGSVGAHSGGFWVPGAPGDVGGDGQGGKGGAGGGGGGGQYCAFCTDGAGNGGGGGGGGGSGGGGGTGGGGGGSAYAIYLVSNGADGVFSSGSRMAGSAGGGGLSGSGGVGGSGGAGGLGNTTCTGEVGAGGNGGTGGGGGTGGNGGSGAVGESAAVLLDSGTAPTIIP